MGTVPYTKKCTHMKKYTVLSFMLSLLLTGSLYSQATLSMQGTIRNSTGSAVPDGTYSLTFKLYTVESGGTAVWSETQSDIRVAGGVYSALLGPLPLSTQRSTYPTM